MKLLEQDKDFNCGVYALHFLLFLNGIPCLLEELESELGTTEENGTSHEDIARVVLAKCPGVSLGCNTLINDLERKLPAIVNYQYCDEDGCDGHYSVVLNITDNTVCMYNPAIGEIENIDKNYFCEKWYSERYGKQWFLSIKK